VGAAPHPPRPPPFDPSPQDLCHATSHTPQGLPQEQEDKGEWEQPLTLPPFHPSPQDLCHATSLTPQGLPQAPHLTAADLMLPLSTALNTLLPT